LLETGCRDFIVNRDDLPMQSPYSLNTLTQILKLLHIATEQLKQNASARLTLEVLLLKIRAL